MQPPRQPNRIRSPGRYRIHEMTQAGAARLAIVLRMAWAAPCTLVGLVLGFAVILGGGSARRVGRVVEFAPGDAGTATRRLRALLPFAAITFGHAVIGLSHADLQRLRAHERVHVRQYEALGPLFFPAYGASSLMAWLTGQSPYRGNRFEIEAFGADPPVTAGQRPGRGARHA